MKLLVLNRNLQAFVELALFERAETLFGLPGLPPMRRTRSALTFIDDPGRALFTAERLIDNSFVAGGLRYIGYTRMANLNYALVYWDYAARSAAIGVEMIGTTSADHPRPIFIRDTGSNDGSVYVVDDDGRVHYWNGYDVSLGIGSPIPAANWFKRTATPEPLSTAGVAPFGWGYTGTLYDELDLVYWDGSFLTYNTARVVGDGTDTGQPGAGRFWGGNLIWIDRIDGRWLGMARGYIFDTGGQVWDGVSEVPYFACNAIWQCQAGASPVDPASWNIFLGPIIPHNADGLAGKFGGASREYSSPHFTLVHAGGRPYFHGDPEPPSQVGDTDEGVIYTIDGGAITVALEYPDVNCYGGPIVDVSGVAHAVISNANTQKIEIWSIGSPNEKVAETEWTGDPHMARAIYHRGAIHILLGQNRSVNSIAGISTGDTEETAWDLLSWDIATDTWTLAPRYCPAVDPTTDTGIWPFIIPARLSAAPAPGGDPGGDPGGGGNPGPDPGGDPCAAYAIFQSPTISLSLWSTHFASSPIVDSGHSAAYWYGVLVSAGINPAFADAMWLKESQRGTVPGALAGAYNIGNIRVHTWGRSISPNVHTGDGDFARYANWEDGILDWVDLWSLPIYAGKTIRQAIYVYAPPSENDTEAYIEQLCGRMTLWDDV